MWFSTENSFNTFVNHLRTNMINAVIEFWFKVWMLIRKYNDWFICLYLLSSVSSINCFLNIGPAVKRIISIQVNNLFEQIIILIWIFALTLTHIGNLIQIILMRLPKNNINCLMLITFWMFRTIIFSVLC